MVETVDACRVCDAHGVFVVALECVAFARGNPFRGSCGMVPGPTSSAHMVGGRCRPIVGDAGLQVDFRLGGLDKLGGEAPERFDASAKDFDYGYTQGFQGRKIRRAGRLVWPVSRGCFRNPLCQFFALTTWWRTLG